MFIFIYRENNPWNVSMNIVPRKMIPYQTFSKLGIWIHLKGVGGLNYVLTFKQDHSCFWAWNDPVFEDFDGKDGGMREVLVMRSKNI